ncbi:MULTISPECIES: hypothetical protein [unclassified Arthrobacter]
MQLALGPVGPVHFPDGETVAGQNPSQLGTVGSGALDANGGDGARS